MKKIFFSKLNILALSLSFLFLLFSNNTELKGFRRGGAFRSRGRGFQTHRTRAVTTRRVRPVAARPGRIATRRAIAQRPAGTRKIAHAKKSRMIRKGKHHKHRRHQKHWRHRRGRACRHCGVRWYRRRFWRWGAVIPLWWKEPILVVENPHYLEEEAIDTKGYSYWKVFNASEKPVIFKPLDGPTIRLRPGGIANAERGRTFAFDTRTPNGTLLRQDATRRHYIKIYDRGYGANHSNSANRWRTWKRKWNKNH